MVITVTCPSCSSSFPVDSNKIPEGGVSARCTQCGDVFRIEKPAPEPIAEAPATDDWVMENEEVAVEAPAEAPPAEAPSMPPATDDPFASDPVPAPDPVVTEPVAEDPLPPIPEPTPEPVATEPEPTPTPEPSPAPAPTGFQFGKRDPTDKAKRLARVLVSDMIMYNAERHASALENGTLKADFEEEIEKSWKEFVEQVGDEIANGPGQEFWTAALNDILAKGEQVF